MLRVAKIDIDLYNISVHRFAGHSKIPSIKCSGHFGGLMFPQWNQFQLFDLSWNTSIKIRWCFGSFWDIFKGSPSKKSGPRSRHRGFLSCLLKIPGNIGGSLGIPWGSGALTDLEAPSSQGIPREPLIFPGILRRQLNKPLCWDLGPDSLEGLPLKISQNDPKWSKT